MWSKEVREEVLILKSKDSKEYMSMEGAFELSEEVFNECYARMTGEVQTNGYVSTIGVYRMCQYCEKQMDTLFGFKKSFEEMGAHKVVKVIQEEINMWDSLNDQCREWYNDMVFANAVSNVKIRSWERKEAVVPEKDTKNKKEEKIPQVPFEEWVAKQESADLFNIFVSGHDGIHIILDPKKVQEKIEDGFRDVPYIVGGSVEPTDKWICYDRAEERNYDIIVQLSELVEILRTHCEYIKSYWDTEKDPEDGDYIEELEKTINSYDESMKWRDETIKKFRKNK